MTSCGEEDWNGSKERKKERRGGGGKDKEEMEAFDLPLFHSHYPRPARFRLFPFPLETNSWYTGRITPNVISSESINYLIRSYQFAIPAAIQVAREPRISRSILPPPFRSMRGKISSNFSFKKNRYSTESSRTKNRAGTDRRRIEN